MLEVQTDYFLDLQYTYYVLHDVPEICQWNYFEVKKDQPFKRQSHKMVKHTQTIRRQIADKLFECVWPVCEIGANGLK